MQQICLALENNRIFSMMHNIFCLQNQSYFSSCGSLTGSFCPKSLCSLHKRRLHSIVLSHPFPLVRSTTRPTTNIHMHTQTRARTHMHTNRNNSTYACTLILDWQIPSEISSELQTTAICLSLSCRASITICYQLQKCGVKKWTVLVCTSKRLGVNVSIWGTAGAILEMSVRLPGCLLRPLFLPDSCIMILIHIFRNHIFPTVQSQHVVNLVSHHNLWTFLQRGTNMGSEKTLGIAFHNWNDDGG